jgi:hypothetical protein
VHEIARATLFAPIVPVSALRPDCPEGLSQIVMRALERNAGDRFASARAMLDALEIWQRELDLALPPALGAPSGSPAALFAAPTPGAQGRCAPTERRPEWVDTLRLGHQGAENGRARGKRRRRSVAAITCLATIGCLVLANEFEVRSRAQSAPAPVSLHGALAQPELLRVLRTRASETSTQVMAQVRSSVRELLESVRGAPKRATRASERMAETSERPPAAGAR